MFFFDEHKQYCCCVFPRQKRIYILGFVWFLVNHHGDDTLVPPVNRLGKISNLCLWYDADNHDDGDICSCQNGYFDVDGWWCWSWWWTIKMDGHDIYGQKFQQVRNEENRFFAITSSKWVRNRFCKKHLSRNPIVMKFAILGLFSRASIDITVQFFDHNKVQTYPTRP